MRDHGVQLYQEEEDLAAALTRFVGAGLALGQGVVFLGSTARWQATTERLRGAGVDTHGAVLGGQLRLFGAKVVLSGCMRHGVPERAAFNDSIGGILRQMRARYPVLRVFGGLTDELWSSGRRKAAARSSASGTRSRTRGRSRCCARVRSIVWTDAPTRVSCKPCAASTRIF
jgi:hypothetical protein